MQVTPKDPRAKPGSNFQTVSKRLSETWEGLARRIRPRAGRPEKRAHPPLYRRARSCRRPTIPRPVIFKQPLSESGLQRRGPGRQASRRGWRAQAKAARLAAAAASRRARSARSAVLPRRPAGQSAAPASLRDCRPKGRPIRAGPFGAPATRGTRNGAGPKGQGPAQGHDEADRPGGRRRGGHALAVDVAPRNALAAEGRGGKLRRLDRGAGEGRPDEAGAGAGQADEGGAGEGRAGEGGGENRRADPPDPGGEAVAGSEPDDIARETPGGLPRGNAGRLAVKGGPGV